jgi:hypothetical protein
VIDVSYAKGTRDKSKQSKSSKKRTRDSQVSDKPSKKRMLEEQQNVQPFLLGTNLQPVDVVPIYVIHTALR